MHTDPIADMLNRISNARKADLSSVIVPYSNQKYAILQVLKTNQFIKEVSVDKTSHQFPELVINLNEDRSLNLKRISKPGRKIYVKNKDLKSIKSGLGIWILSTPKGILSQLEAKKANVGGELICEVY